MSRTAFVEQSGNITPGHITKWIANGIVADAGVFTSLNSVLVTGLIVSEPTKADATAATIPSAVTGIQTYGDSVVGDGGAAFYVKVNASTEGGFQSVDGAFWALTGYWYQFGAVASSNIGAALNAFMVNVADLGGGTVLVPPGSFTTSVQIIVPTTVVLKGAGKRSTTILASGLATSTAVVRLGRATDTPTFDCRLEDIMIRCGSIAGSIGVYSNTANEGCGCFRSAILDWKDTGIFYDEGTEHFSNFDLEIYNSNNSNNYGIKVASANWPSGGVAPITFDRVTVVGNGIGNTTACIYLKNCVVVMHNIHLEDATDGVLIDGNNVSGVVSVVDAFVVTNVIHFNGGTSPLLLLGVWGVFSYTNLILDDLTGTALTEPFYVPIWTRRIPFTPLPPTTVTTSPYVVLETDTTIIGNRGAGVGLILPTPSNSTGRVLGVKTILGTVTSISNDVVPLIGGAAGSDILPGQQGGFAVLKCDGTNWVIIEQGAPSGGTFQSIPGGSTYIVVSTDIAISCTGTATLTLTLPTPASFPGRQLLIRTVDNFAVNSDASNIGSLIGGVGAGILAATAGKWAILVSDGGSFWQIMAAN